MRQILFSRSRLLDRLRRDAVAVLSGSEMERPLGQGKHARENGVIGIVSSENIKILANFEFTSGVVGIYLNNAIHKKKRWSMRYSAVDFFH